MVDPHNMADGRNRVFCPRPYAFHCVVGRNSVDYSDANEAREEGVSPQERAAHGRHFLLRKKSQLYDKKEGICRTS